MFDLHDSMRRAKRVDELEPLYNTTFKEVTDAYFKGVSVAFEPHLFFVGLEFGMTRADSEIMFS